MEAFRESLKEDLICQRKNIQQMNQKNVLYKWNRVIYFSYADKNFVQVKYVCQIY